MEGIATAGRNRAGKRAGQDDLARLQRHAVRGETLGQPGNAVGRVIEDAGRDTHATAHHRPHHERHPLGPQIGHLGEKMWKKFRPVRCEASDRRVGSLLLRA